MESLLILVKGMTLSQILDKKITPRVTQVFKDRGIEANFEYFELPSMSLTVTEKSTSILAYKSVWIFNLNPKARGYWLGYFLKELSDIFDVQESDIHIV